LTGETPDDERFLALVAEAEKADPRLTPLQAAIVTAAELGIASDSRSFSRLFGVAHALALRELGALSDLGDVLHILKRDPRTLRTHYALLADRRPEAG
jgi:hypothetical protein